MLALQWACERGTKECMAAMGVKHAQAIYDAGACTAAAAGGQLEALKYLHSIGCHMDCGRVVSAAALGHMHVLKWARSNGAKLDSSACEAAAACGQLKALMWLHEQGCEWDESVCANAAEYGRLAELRFAHENGCKWDGMTLRQASRCGHGDVLAYALAHDCTTYVNSDFCFRLPSTPPRPSTDEERAEYEEKCRAAREAKDDLAAEHGPSAVSSEL